MHNVLEKSKVTGMKVELSAYFSGFQQMTITAEENQASVKCSCRWGEENLDQEWNWSKDQWKAFLDDLFNLGVAEWKLDYWDNGILDGLQWEVDFSLEDGEVSEIKGSNDFPRQWDEFLKLLWKHTKVFPLK